MIVRRFAVAVLAATLAVGACKGDPPPMPEPPTADQDSLQAYRDSVANAERMAREAAAAAAAERAAAAAERAAAAAARTTLMERVLFDYDESAIRMDQQSLLRQKVAILRASPQVQIRIAGHADERGSTEYNLALGTSRAAAIRDYLTDSGLPASRFSIVSYGEERPSNRSSSEMAWSQNRRAEFEITAGSSAINPGN
ncbi:MAG: OmpA family protein [Gemmatimonadales bacterium]|jgi:peptidoglycan-associated lipoprotein|nr:OmpA family protein [Gemmatimonadales bacterium]MDG2240216.1 OmpA family protein [Longimicrobiales bacterium]NCG31873.1 OmpA family protein [Pseudomonadota bacterium]MBT4186140.1 OmpA family protein [Gemmatimonadales bacterium]MBT4913163.1 OmpA family protein [Gemmatimonadales bacterium]